MAANIAEATTVGTTIRPATIPRKRIATLRPLTLATAILLVASAAAATSAAADQPRQPAWAGVIASAGYYAPAYTSDDYAPPINSDPLPYYPTPLDPPYTTPDWQDEPISPYDIPQSNYVSSPHLTKPSPSGTHGSKR